LINEIGKRCIKGKMAVVAHNISYVRDNFTKEPNYNG
jgi:hypothetical protein